MTYHWHKLYDSVDDMEKNLALNRPFYLEIKGHRICMVRTTFGLFAVQDKCPHNGASLSRGFCSEKNEVICPLHRYSYDLQSGKATSGGAYALSTYPIESKDNGVWLGIKASWWEL